MGQAKEREWIDLATDRDERAETPVSDALAPIDGAGLVLPPSGNLLNIYLKEMALEPLLSHEEEIELARQIELGRRATRTLNEAGGNEEHREQDRDQIKNGQAARERMSRANTRLVISIAKRYRGYGMPFLDLIQDGNEGLMRAIDRYDPSSGFRFSTYATWWIRQAITRSLADRNRTIRLPAYVGDRLREVSRVAQRMEVERGRSPSPEEIAAEMGESPTRVRRLMHWANRTVSLDQPASEVGDSDLGDLIEDGNLPGPDEISDVHLLNERLEGLLRCLPAREARILRLRYGLEDGQTRTLQQIGDSFGLSRERIRQVEKRSLKKLRLIAAEFQLEQFVVAG